jgi:hypothetical protein
MSLSGIQRPWPCLWAAQAAQFAAEVYMVSYLIARLPGAAEMKLKIHQHLSDALKTGESQRMTHNLS